MILCLCIFAAFNLLQDGTPKEEEQGAALPRALPAASPLAVADGLEQKDTALTSDPALDIWDSLMGQMGEEVGRHLSEDEGRRWYTLSPLHEEHVRGLLEQVMAAQAPQLGELVRAQVEALAMTR